MSQTPRELEATCITQVPFLPGYEIDSVVGTGGFGTVFRARQERLDRTVALKVLRPDPADNPVVAARFESEALTLAKLHHPNIVQVYDCGRHEDRVYLAMELLEGEDLHQRIVRAGALDERTAWLIARQAAAGLAHAAAQGIVHRDIKPANLFLVAAPAGIGLPDGVPMVKVMDFGLAKWTAEPADPLRTAAGSMLGTPGYMAPEQHREPGHIDERADIYALGATVFHALAGRPPFNGSNLWDIMAEKMAGTPRLGSLVSRETADLVAAMMSSDPASRIGSYEELCRRIDALPAICGAARDRRAERASSPRRRRASVWLAAAVTIAASVAAAASALTSRHGDAPPSEESPMPVLQPTGEYLALFDGRSLKGWFPRRGQWDVEVDDEKVKVLAGTGLIALPFDGHERYRLTLGLDVHTAAAAEVQFGLPDGRPASQALRYGLQISKAGGARLGTRLGDGGAFQPQGPAIPFPAIERLADRRPYLEVKIERAGSWWAVWFDGREVGRGDSAGQPWVGEIRLAADSGRVRVDSAVLAMLRE